MCLMFGSTAQVVKPTLSPYSYDVFLPVLSPRHGCCSHTMRGTMEDKKWKARYGYLMTLGFRFTALLHHCHLFTNNLFAAGTKLIRIVGFSEMDDPHQKPVLFLIVAANYYRYIQIHCWEIGHFTSLFTKLFSFVPGVLGETLCVCVFFYQNWIRGGAPPVCWFINHGNYGYYRHIMLYYISYLT